jgi:TonB family protein
MRDKGAWYKEEWRKKVERIGNLNYPDEARRQQIYGSLRLMVSINRDGSLYEVLVLESSGQPLLDQAAQRIVRLAAPFAPFTGDLAEFDRLEIIRTWRFARGTCPATDPAKRGSGLPERERGHLHRRFFADSRQPAVPDPACPAPGATLAPMKNLAPATSSTSS